MLSDRWADAQATRYLEPCTTRRGTIKRRYGHRDMAWAAAAYYRLIHGTIQHPYHCHRCRMYHLTRARDTDTKRWAKAVLKRIHRGERP